PPGHPFDGRDGASPDLDWKQQAAQLGLAIHQDRARPALAQLATVLGPGQLHVLAKHFEQCLVHGNEQLTGFAVDLERENDSFDLALDFVPHQDPSISLTAFAHSQRSGTTACARLDAGAGSSGYTRIARMPRDRAGSTSFSS